MKTLHPSRNVFSLNAGAVLLALVVGLGVASAPASAANPEEEKKSAELIKLADEAKARATQAEAVLKAAQAKATQLQGNLTKLKAQIRNSEKAIKDA